MPGWALAHHLKSVSKKTLDQRFEANTILYVDRIHLNLHKNVHTSFGHLSVHGSCMLKHHKSIMNFMMNMTS